MKKNAIVSLANSDYFELLNELIDSIKRFDESKNVAICVLDAGLNQDQKNILKKKSWKDKLGWIDVRYAVKCNSLDILIRDLNNSGCGFDAASYGEIKKLLD